ncbi:MAG: hypothetical protein NZ534_08895, partial [Bacteroidia bacterium]|nr:hypothetical protein [Bacteroidia bacterium]
QLTATIPLNLPPGQYRVRVNALAPPVEGQPAPQTVFIANATAQISGLPDVMCVNDPIVCMQANPPGGTFTGGPGVQGNCFNPGAAGEGVHLVSYSGVTAQGCQFFATDTVTVVGVPVIDATVSGGGGGTPYQLRAVGPPALNYVWQPGGLVGQMVFVNPSQTTTYTVYAGVQGSNCMGMDTVTVFVGGSTGCEGFNVQILYDGPNPVCSGQTVSFRASPPGFINSYTWTVNGMPTMTIGDVLTTQVFETTTVMLRGTSPAGCTDTAMYTLFVTQGNFQLSAQSTPASCPTCNDGTITIFPPGLAFYQVNGMPINGNVATGLPPGFYQVTAGDANGCVQTITVEVGGGNVGCTFLLTVQTEPASCNTCPDGAMFIFPNNLGVYYVNNVPYFSSVITGLLPGFYEVRATDSLGCVGQAFVQIPVDSGGCVVPAAIAPLPEQICTSDSPICLSATPPGGTFGGSGIVVLPFCTAFDPALAGPGVHTINYFGTTPNGCEFFASSTIVVIECGCNLQVTAFAQPETLCVGQSAILTAQANLNNVLYTWFDQTGAIVGSSQAIAVAPSFPSSYRVEVRAANIPNCIAEASVFVSVYPVPQFTAVGQNASCQTCNDGRIVVNPPNLLYYVNGMPMTVTGGAITGLTPGTYSVTAMDSLTGCMSAPMMVTVGFNPPACPTPTGLAASNITANSALLTWNAV